MQCQCGDCEKYREVAASREKLGLLPSVNVPHPEDRAPDAKDKRIADLERQIADMTAWGASLMIRHDDNERWKREAVQRAEAAEAERDAIAAQARQHLLDAGRWEQDAAHWQARAMDAEAEAARLRADAIPLSEERDALLMELRRVRGEVVNRDAEVARLQGRVDAAEDFWRAVENVADSNCYIEFGNCVTEALHEYRDWRKANITE